MAEKLISQYFSDNDLWIIKAKIAEAELKTSGEIRVKIREKCENELKGKTFLQAQADFYSENLDKTRDETGVLILLILQEQRLEILADKGINSKLSQGELNSIVIKTTGFFHNNRFVDGIIYAIRALSDHLTKHFPRKSDDKNELPNDVITEDGK